MALPAGRRGIRANLVRSDGSIKELADIADTVDGLTDTVDGLTDTVSNIGNVVVGAPTIASGDAIASGWNDIATITLPPGVWMLEGYLAFHGTSNPLVSIRFDTRTSEYSTVQTMVSNNVCVQLCMCFAFDTERTFKLQAYGINNPLASAVPGVRAVRIK